MSIEALPAVSITVVAFNSEPCIRTCLDSIKAVAETGLADVIVVDNASPDRSAQIVGDSYTWVTLLRSEVNLGFAGGCNLSWPRVRGRYWLLLNPDVVVPPGGIEQFVRWMDQHPQLGAASPELVDSVGHIQCAARRFQSIGRTLMEASRLHLLLPQRVRGEMFLGSYRRESGDHLDVDWVPGAVLIARRQAVEAAGLLAEGVLMYGEDSEWCWRIRNAGWRIGLCAGLRFIHHEGVSALRTWGDVERNWRMWHGIYHSCSRMRGPLYTRAIALANTAAFALEAFHPRRSPLERGHARLHLRTHIGFLRNGMHLSASEWSLPHRG